MAPKSAWLPVLLHRHKSRLRERTQSPHLHAHNKCALTHPHPQWLSRVGRRLPRGRVMVCPRLKTRIPWQPQSTVSHDSLARAPGFKPPPSASVHSQLFCFLFSLDAEFCKKFFFFLICLFRGKKKKKKITSLLGTSSKSGPTAWECGEPRKALHPLMCVNKCMNLQTCQFYESLVRVPTLSTNGDLAK